MQDWEQRLFGAPQAAVSNVVPLPSASGRNPQYVTSAMQREVQAVETAPEGTRNDTLNRAAFNLGTLVAGGELPRGDVEQVLLSAAMASGLAESESRATIASGLRAGAAHPRTAPEPDDVDVAPMPRFDPETGELLDDDLVHDAHADLSWAAGGQIPHVEPPVWGRRTDDVALWYAGKVNGVFGDPESAKTWLAMQALVEALDAGERGVLVDLDHNGAVLTVQRLVMLGADPAVIADPQLFRYYAPDDRGELAIAVCQAVEFLPAIAILDSLGELVPMMGRDSKDNDQITSALRLVAFPLARAGAAVITIDHLPKAGESRDSGYAIGGMAKKRAMDGSYIRAEVRKPPAPGQIGKVSLRVAKDRAGRLREHAPGGFIGTFVLDSTEPGRVLARIDAADERPPEERPKFRPTGLMQKVSHLLSGMPDGLSKRQIFEEVRGKQSAVKAAIEVLVDEGYVSMAPRSGRGGGFTYALLKPYFEASDLTLRAVAE